MSRKFRFKCLNGILRSIAFAAVLLLIPVVGNAQVDETGQSQIAAWFERDPSELSVTPGPLDGMISTVSVDGELLGWVGSSFRINGSIGYSGKPIDVLVGVNTDGVLVGSYLMRQSEPILTIGISPKDLADYVDGFNGLALIGPAAPKLSVLQDILPQAISGATVSSGVIRDAIIRTARSIAVYMINRGAGVRTVDRLRFEALDWASLVDSGAISTQRLSFAALRQAMPTAIGLPDGKGLFTELSVAVGTSPSIGQSLLGRRIYEELAAKAGPQDTILILLGRGLYSFKGTRWRKSGLFDRFELVQGGQTWRLSATEHVLVEKLNAPGAPDLREMIALLVPGASGFNGATGFQIDMTISKSTTGGGEQTYRMAVPYRIPDRFLVGGDEAAKQAEIIADQPLWRTYWHDKRFHLAILVIQLFVLTGILFGFERIVHSKKFYAVVRLGFLAVTLVWMGWIAQAQLSVVHVVNFVHSLLSGFRWELFLLDPLVFVLWSFVALGMLFWGRGIYCGWLCPFGALQELVNLVAKQLGIKQYEIPFIIHERLWTLKYAVFLGILGVSLYSVDLAFIGAEIEPFKTSIILRFIRDWPFVLFALMLLVASLFIERFYCRYLCPLGAALALPAKLKLFDWLNRRTQCGRECRLCATKCSVQAIHPLGQINPNECIYCLRCQRIYNDDEVCVPLKARQRRRSASRPPPTAPPPRPEARPEAKPASGPEPGPEPEPEPSVGKAPG